MLFLFWMYSALWDFKIMAGTSDGYMLQQGDVLDPLITDVPPQFMLL